MILYLFYIRKVFLEGTSKSSTAFFTVYHLRHSSKQTDSGGMINVQKARVLALIGVLPSLAGGEGWGEEAWL